MTVTSIPGINTGVGCELQTWSLVECDDGRHRWVVGEDVRKVIGWRMPIAEIVVERTEDTETDIGRRTGRYWYTANSRWIKTTIEGLTHFLGKKDYPQFR